jgi:hypothetical protein
MQILMADESNFPPKGGKYFVMAGLIFTSEQIRNIHHGVEKIRIAHGYQADESFKFRNSSKVSSDRHKIAKSELLDLLVANNVEMLATYVHEQILKNQEPFEYWSKSLNLLTSMFHDYLTAKEAHRIGGIMMDRLDKNAINQTFEDFSSRFNSGLTWPSGFNRNLRDKIAFFGVSNDNSSHLSSCVDIALGSLRYVLDSSSAKAEHSDVISNELMPKIYSLLWKARVDSGVTGYGLVPSPREVGSIEIALQYSQTWEYLKACAGVK